MLGHYKLLVPTINRLFVNFLKRYIIFNRKNTLFLGSLSSGIVNKISKVNHTILYDLGKWNKLQSGNHNSVKYGTKIMTDLTLQTCSLAPRTIKNCESLKSFKQKVSKWKPNYHDGYAKSIYMLISSEN